ncbi:hypothetical protein B0T14DRAFT_563915 [Immersiella caudata]|uniref:DUF6594 domain-containing protein n=1 Tax=Immersiella caudata TaxID=314043 RepID=A0AA39WW33_9PEZI|nr:hypothetical protein B0T14DRAFT_563915 [Immersiella caudata]
MDTTYLDLDTLLGLKKEEEDHRLLELATEFSRRDSLVLSSFERFATLCLFHCQHELVQLEEELSGTADLLRIIERHPFHVSSVVDSLSRLLIAIIGAMFLLVPMIVMTVWPGPQRNSSVALIVTSASVLLFAISISVFTKSSNQQIIAASAVYTAVLVVFVGSTAPTGST